MSWRTVVITSHAKLTYKNDYMIVRTDKVQMIHLSEIHTLIIDSTQVSVTAYLLCELVKRKVKVIFCDEKRNPISELTSLYGRYNSSKKIDEQIHWDKSMQEKLITEIIRQKIRNQANMLKKYECDYAELLETYAKQLLPMDKSNREGVSARVYFNSLFGKSFTREDVNDINAALDYGYSILLSAFNKEIVSCGYLTQLGIKHTNEYNPYNLTCDLMEPFRIVIDEIVYLKRSCEFDQEYKMHLVDILNKRVKYKGKEYFLSNAIQKYVQSLFRALEHLDYAEVELFEFK